MYIYDNCYKRVVHSIDLAALVTHALNGCTHCHSHKLHNLLTNLRL